MKSDQLALSREQMEQLEDTDRVRYMGKLALYAAYAKQYELAVELSANVPMFTTSGSWTMDLSDCDRHPVLYAVTELQKVHKFDEALALIARVKNESVALQRQKLTDPTSTKEVPGTQVLLEQVDETLKRLEVKDGRPQAADSLRKLKLQKHIYESYGGGRALTGGSQGLVLVDAQKQWLDEREFQIANNEFRKLLESYWTIASHRESKLIEGTDVRTIFDFNLPAPKSIVPVP